MNKLIKIGVVAVALLFSQASSANIINVLDDPELDSIYAIWSPGSFFAAMGAAQNITLDSNTYNTDGNGHLWAINSRDEQLSVLSWFSSIVPGRQDIWTGLERASTGSFAWTNGDALTYTNFRPNEPSYGGGEFYVHIVTDLFGSNAMGGWNDITGNYNMFSIIEYSRGEAIPPAAEVNAPAALGLLSLGLAGLLFRRKQ